MIFSDDNIETVNVLISKKAEHIDAFFESGELEDGLVLGTNNGTLISMEHSLGAGVGPDQNITIKFADSGGATLQDIFSLNINHRISGSKFATKQDLFLISYGSGPDRANWHGPSYHYLYNTDYEILADALEITTLYFTPSLFLAAGGAPPIPGSAAVRPTKMDFGEIIGTVHTNGTINFNSTDELVESLLKLYTKAASKEYGLPALIKIPPEIIKQYLTQELTEKSAISPNTFVFGTSDLNTLTNVVDDFNNFNINVDNSTDIQVHTDPDGNVVLNSFESEKINALTTLLQLPSITLTTEVSPSIMAPVVVPLMGPPIASPTPAPAPGYWNNPSISTLMSIPDATAAITTFIPPPSPAVTNNVNLVMNLSIDYRLGRESFSSVFIKLFKALRSNGGLSINLENKDVFASTGVQALDLQPVVYALNDQPTLQAMIDNGLIDSSWAGNSVVIGGDITSILDIFGHTGTGPAFQKHTDDFGLVGDPKDPTWGVIPPSQRHVLVLETSKNILSFAVQSKQPSIAFFRDNIFYKAADDTTTREEYVEFISSFLKKSVEKYGGPSTDNPFSEDVFYDYKEQAKELYNNLETLDPSAFGNLFLATDTKFAGLLTYMYWYYEYVAKGTIYATANTIPYFNYSSPLMIGHPVLVRVRRNPSTYDHLIDKLYNSFNSGRYSMHGFKHSITNTLATSTFYLNKTVL